jgi:hypothetical protein
MKLRGARLLRRQCCFPATEKTTPVSFQNGVEPEAGSKPVPTPKENKPRVGFAPAPKPRLMPKACSHGNSSTGNCAIRVGARLPTLTLAPRSANRRADAASAEIDMNTAKRVSAASESYSHECPQRMAARQVARSRGAPATRTASTNAKRSPDRCELGCVSQTEAAAYAKQPIYSASGAGLRDLPQLGK